MLSICIPTYQRAALLREGLERLSFTQTLPFPVEIIVSDNASTDETFLVVEAFIAAKKLKIRYYRHTENLGAEANLLSAFRRARGKWCLYLADDDFLEPNCLQKTIEKLEKTPGVVACYCPWERVDGVTGIHAGPEFDMGPEAVFRSEEAMLLFGRVCQRRIFPEIGIYRTEIIQNCLTLVMGQHWAFVWLFRLLREGKIILQPESFYCFQTRTRHGNRHIGVEQVLERQDYYRAGMEEALRIALSLSPPPRRPEYQKLGLELITYFMAGRIWNAANVAMRIGRFRLALELSRRLSFYPSNMPEFPKQLALMALVEELKDLLRLAGGPVVWVPEGTDLDALVEVMGKQGIASRRGGEKREEEGVLVRSNAERKTMLEAGISVPERIFSLESLLGVVSA